MAVLLPTTHQEKEHQEESRGGQEKPREGQVRMGQVPQCSQFLGSQGGKGSFLPEKEWEEMEAGRVNKGF